MYTEYKFDPKKISGLVAQRQAALKENRGLSDLLGFGLGVASRRLAKDPGRYLDYGPYWWALKSVLNANGYSYGQESDPGLVEAYRGASDVQTLIMADQFRTEFLAENQVGTCKFRLDADGDEYILFDSDMALRLVSA